jgi:hypothetical protein
MRRVVEKNFSMFGEHPNFLIHRRHQVDALDFFLHPSAPLRIMPSCVSGSSQTEVTVERELLPKVRLGDLLVDPGVRLQGVLMWSRGTQGWHLTLYMLISFQMMIQVWLKILLFLGGKVQHCICKAF